MIGPQTSDIRIPSFAHYAQQDAYALSMVRRLHVDLRLATQVLVLQVAVVTLTLGIAGALIAFMSHERLAAQYEDRSLDMGRAIAFAPLVRSDVARYDAAPRRGGRTRSHEGQRCGCRRPEGSRTRCTCRPPRTRSGRRSR